MTQNTTQTPDTTQPLDTLGREADLDLLMQILRTLSKEQASETIALVGQWGSGKTFFLDELLKPALDAENQRMWDECSPERRYLVFDYNCWQYDYYEEPLWAIVSALLDSVDNQLKPHGEAVDEVLKAGWETAKETLNAVLQEVRIPGINVPLGAVLNVRKTFAEKKRKLREARGDIYYSFVKSLEKLRNGLRKLAEPEYTLVFIVDELDRCLPTYAIRVLERLHHVFSELPNTIVLLAVDEKQLDSTVKQIFGEATSTEGYLEKFIDFKFDLDMGWPSYSTAVEDGDIQDFIKKYPDYCAYFELDNPEDRSKAAHYIAHLFDGIDIRRQEHLMKRLWLAHKFAITDGKKRDWFFMVFELLWLVLSEQYGIKDFLPVRCWKISGNIFWAKKDEEEKWYEWKTPFSNEIYWITESRGQDSFLEANDSTWLLWHLAFSYKYFKVFFPFIPPRLIPPGRFYDETLVVFDAVTNEKISFKMPQELLKNKELHYQYQKEFCDVFLRLCHIIK